MRQCVAVVGQDQLECTYVQRNPGFNELANLVATDIWCELDTVFNPDSASRASFSIQPKSASVAPVALHPLLPPFLLPAAATSRAQLN